MNDDRAGRPLPTVEVIGVSDGPDGGGPQHGEPAHGGHGPAGRGRLLGGLGVLVAIGVFFMLTDAEPDPAGNDDTGSDEPAISRTELHSLDRLDALVTAGALPSELLAAEVYRAAPGPDTARFLLRSVGGADGVVAATAEGSFDLVTFHPFEPNHLVASHRSGYGAAENQHLNEEWTITNSGALLVSPLAPGDPHDFAHYNDYGTVSLWTRVDQTTAEPDTGSDTEKLTAPDTANDFAPRTVTLGPIPTLGDRRTDPLYPSRSVIVFDTLFALTGDADYYSNSRAFDSLVADRGDGQVVLDDGEPWAWVDSPMPGVAVAYPAEDDGVTAVWSSETLEPLVDHPLAGRRYHRLAVSGSETTMVGVTFDGALEAVDLATDRVTARFGLLDPDGIAQPITLNHDGTIAVTVDHDGTVTVWWVGDPEPIAVIEGDAGPPRFVSEYRAPRVSSAVAADAERVAVRHRARPGSPTTWSIIDTNPARWVEVACERAGRTLTAGERVELGLDLLPPACS